MVKKSKASEDLQDVDRLIEQRVYAVADTGETARNIHHWKKEGLLLNNDNYSSETKNKKLLFNLTEYFWIKTIQQCRQYGLSIKHIKKVKHDVEQYLNFSFTGEVEKVALEVVAKKINEDFADKSDEFKSGALKWAKAEAKEKKIDRSGIETIVRTIISSGSQSGLVIFIDSGVVTTMVYIEVDGITNFIPETLMTTSHFYISFNDIFDELGLSDHFKPPEILTQKKRNVIKLHTDFMNSHDVKSVTSVNLKDSVETKVEFKHIEDSEKIERFKMKYGDGFSWRNRSHKGKSNFFEFKYNKKHDR